MLDTFFFYAKPFLNLFSFMCPLKSNIAIKIVNATQKLPDTDNIPGEYIVKLSFETKEKNEFIRMASIELYASVRIIGNKPQKVL